MRVFYLIKSKKQIHEIQIKTDDDIKKDTALAQLTKALVKVEYPTLTSSLHLNMVKCV